MYFKMNKHKFRYLIVSETIHMAVQDILDYIRDDPDNIEIAHAITKKVMDIVTAEMEQ